MRLEKITFLNLFCLFALLVNTGGYSKVNYNKEHRSYSLQAERFYVTCFFESDNFNTSHSLVKFNSRISAISMFAAPVITCPANVTANTSDDGTGDCSTVVNAIDLTTDGTEVIQTWTLSGATTGSSPGTGINDASGQTFNVGVTTVTYYVENAGFENDTCNFTVTVTDDENPTVTAAANVTADTSDDGTGDCDVDISITNATFNDNCSSTLTWAMTGAVTDSGSGQVGTYNFPIGVTTITYTNSDGVNTNATDAMTVTVTDDENPTITSCPSNVNQNVDPGDCDYTFNPAEPVFADNCSVTSVTWVMSGATTGSGANSIESTNFATGVTTITYTAVDAAANSIQCAFTVTVTDNEDPVISCPTNQSVNVDPGQCDAAVTIPVATFTDNCAGGSITNDFNAGGANASGTYPVGTTNVTFTATDAAGNTDQCSITVTVTDNEDPVISCPANIPVSNNPSTCGVVVNYTPPIGTDNCPGVVTTQTDGTGLSSGSTFPVGTTTLEYTATDGSGNTAVCSFDIIVTDAAANASVSIGATATTICENTSVTFTATPTNGGATPSYQWQVNGGNVGTDSPTYTTSTLNNADAVRVIMTSSLSACGTTATSNVINMTVNNERPVSFIINGTSTICSGDSVTFSPGPITNGGASPGYEWFVNGGSVATTQNYTTSTLNDGDVITMEVTSYVQCAIPVPALSTNSITITVNPDATISDPGNKNQSVCINTPIAAINFTVGGGGTGATVSGLPAGVTGNYSGGTYTLSGTPTASGTFNYTVNTTGTCAQTSESGTITVNPDATISNPGNKDQAVCINTPIAAINFTIGGGGTGATVSGLPAGVTGNYSGGTYTLSGTPTASGSFNYTVNTTGTCAQTSQNGTITVNPDATISDPGNKNQSVCINTPIAAINFTVGGGGTGATVSGLPAGVTGNYSAGTFTISGSPTTSGTFNYTVNTTGTCVQTSESGTITVDPDATISNPANKDQAVCINTAIADIDFTIGGGGTGATVSGLPAGVTGSFSAGTFTITGTPSASGTFNYTVNTTGTCAQTSESGTITVNPDATISDPGNKNQSVCINTAIAAINFTVGGGGTGATVSGLPAGVTGNYSAGTYTLSGTPTASGTFNYTVNTTGTCAQTSESGTITVNPDATISNPGNKDQAVCINTPIAAINFTIGGGGTGATVSGLPAGVTGSFSAGTFTISGTPTASGSFNYTVNTTGTCAQTSQNGTITVNPDATISDPGNKNQSVCINTAIAAINFTVGGGGTGATVSGLPAGVTGNYSAGTFTISGSPTTSGTFNYTVNTTGTCVQTSESGTITVDPDATISNPANKDQAVCINTAIADIDFTIGGGGTGATVSGLPAGVTGSFSAGTFTISGTPSASGTFNYTVNTTGTCAQTSESGTITVNPDATISNPGNKDQAVCINTAIAAINFTIGGGGTGATVSGLPAGVTGNYSGGTYTLSGTPTASGTFNYTVNTTGTCAQTSESGTITVNPDATISNPGNKDQAVCINTPIAAINFTVGGGGTGATVSGLPAGVTGSFSAGTFTISGTPTASGSFNYTVNTTGTCAQTSQNGTITVNPDATISNPGNKNQSVCINTAIAAINFTVGGGGTGATVSGLPAGVTGNYSGGTYTLSGTPTVSGTFNYTVSTTGCGLATQNGTLTIYTTPATPGAIAGDSAICPVITGAVYSVPNDTNVVTYNWSFPSGFTITSGTGTNSVTVNISALAANGNVTVTATNPCSTSASSVLPISVGSFAAANAGPDQTVCASANQITLAGTVGGVINRHQEWDWTDNGAGGSFSNGGNNLTGTYSFPGGFSPTSNYGEGLGIIKITIYTIDPAGSCNAVSDDMFITMVANTTISNPGNKNQTVCINTAISNINFTISAAGTGATVSGLPAGVTGNYSAGTFTISGTPSVSGSFPYTVNTTGSCPQTSQSGTITVNPNATISNPGNKDQSICINNAIASINFSIGGGGTGATVSGLPTGVTGNFSGGTFTVSGTPTVSGSFPYTVTTTGTCAQTSQNGTITVNPDATINNPANKDQSLCVNTAINSISFNIGGGGTGATLSGSLPTGVTGNFSGGTYTISGTPTASGIFNYTVNTTGTCVQTSQNGTITVNPDATINNPANKDQTLCINSAIANINFTIGGGGTGATVSGLPAGVSGNLSGSTYTISGTPTISGSFNYTVNTTGTCVQTSESGTLIITPIPTATISYAGTPFCDTVGAGQSVTLNGTNAYTGGTYTAAPAGLTIDSTSGDINPSTSTAGTYTVTYTIPASGGCATETATTSVTITAQPTATISYAGTPFCDTVGAGQSVTLNGTNAYTGGTYTAAPGGLTINASSGDINPSTSTPGTYTVTYTIPATAGCSIETATTSVTITGRPTASISYAGTPFCDTLGSGQSVTLNGTYAYTGGTYTAAPGGLTINASSGDINPSTSTPGTYTVTYTIPASDGCATETATTSVTITAQPTATISYAGTPFCDTVGAGQSVTLNGTYAYTGGTYTAAPGGLTINASSGDINPSTSTAGTYTVTYTIPASGGCATETATTSVTITGRPTATISYAGTPFCDTLTSGQAVTRTGTFAFTGGTYTAAPAGLTINASSGAITPSSSTPGTYTVTYTIPATAGCSTETATTSVTITGRPTASISYAGTPFCDTLTSGQAVTRTGTFAFTGGTYSAPAGLTINSSSGDINPSTSTAGTYTVTYTIPASGGCATETATTSVTITAQPTATISYAGTPFCDTVGAGQSVTLNGTNAYTGGTYSAPAGLTINSSSGDINPSTSTAGTYTVTYTIPASGGCATETATTSVTITARPTATISYASTSFCNSDSSSKAVTLTGTNAYTGGTYTAAPAGLTINSGSGAITPSSSSTGNYTITYTIPASAGCATETATTSVVIKEEVIITTEPQNVGVCVTEPANLSVVAFGDDLTYQWYKGTAVGTPVSNTANISGATSNVLSFAMANISDAGIYYVIVSGDSSCSSKTSIEVTLNVNQVINITDQPDSATLCEGSDITFSVAATGSIAGYQWRKNGINIGGATSTSYTLNNITSTDNGNYDVVISSPGDLCSKAYSTIATLTVTQIPTATISYAGTPFCDTVGAGQSVTLNGTNAYTGGTYTAAPAGLTIDSTSGDINPSTSTAGTYTVTYTIPASGGCATETATTSVTITAQPTATISYAGTPFCDTVGAGQSVTLNGTNAYTGGTYTAAPGGLTINASSGDINPSTSTPGTYTVTYTIPATAGCSIETATTSVTITGRPTASISYAGTPFCDTLGSGQSVTLNGTYAYTGGTYTAAPGGLTINASSGDINPSTSTPGTYTVTYTIPASDGCATETATTSVTITAQPTATISYAGTPFCDTVGAGQSVTLNGTYAYTGGTYTAAPGGLTINASSGDINPSTSTPGTYTVTYTIPASGGCATETATTSVTITGRPTATISYAGTPFCDTLTSGQAVTRTGTFAFTGGTYTAAPAGLTINASSGAITPSSSTPGTYTVTYTIPATAGCSTETATTSVTITGRPTASISYAGTPFCDTLTSGQAVTRTGTFAFTGGTYSAPAGLTINASSGAITPSSSTPGTYTVTYTIPATAGCSTETATTSVTITGRPTASISYAGTPFCNTLTSGQAVTRTGTFAFTGGTYTAAPAGLTINASSGAITPSSSTPGTYTVTYTIPATAGCSTETATTSVTITGRPTASISYAGTPFCDTLTSGQAVTRTGTFAFTGGTYSAPAGLTINASSGAITPSSSTPGTYTVTYTIPATAGCSTETATTSVTITGRPTATISYAGTPFCDTLTSGQAVTRTGTFAFTGGTYTAAPGGLTINASSGDINPSTSTAGTYTVTYTIPASGGCSTETATTSVTITAQPTATISYAGTPFCDTVGGGQTVTLNGTNAYTGGTYSAPAGLTIDSTSGDINPSTSTAGTYTVTYTIPASGGCSTETATTSVTITALPVATFNYDSTDYCSNDPNPILSYSGGGVAGTFTASPAGLSLNASTGAIVLSTSTVGTYTVTNTIASSGGCPIVSENTVITISQYIAEGAVIEGFAIDDLGNPGPVSNQILACHQGDGTLTLNINGAYAPYVLRWEYLVNGAGSWATVAGTNAGSLTYNFVGLTGLTAYRAIISSGAGCGQVISATAYVSVIPPNLKPEPVTASPTEFCLGDSSLFQSSTNYGAELLNEGGLFQTGQLNTNDPDSWLIDEALRGLSASGNNVKENNWSGTNPKSFTVGGTPYSFDSGDPKFAVASGNENKNQQNDPLYSEGGVLMTTLSTPIFSLLGVSDMTFTFDEAFVLTGASSCDSNSYPAGQAVIQISTDGGTTYNTISDSAVVPNSYRTNGIVTGPANSGNLNNFQVNTTTLDLSEYFGQTRVRLRFVLIRNCESVWALDNFHLPAGDAGSTVQWTDQFNVVISNENTASVTPITPGYQIYTVTTFINGCRSEAPDGSEDVALTVDFAYATAKQKGNICGQGISLYAYDNSKTAYTNYLELQLAGLWVNGLYTVPSDPNFDYAGTGAAGEWSIVSGPSGIGINWAAEDPADYFFPSINDPRAHFDGPSGQYELAWTVFGSGGDCTANVTINVLGCSNLDFDGRDDNVTYKYDYDLNSNPFSIEIWVKPNAEKHYDNGSSAGPNDPIQTIVSKRDATSLVHGYDLRIENNKVSFNWNSVSGTLISPNLGTSRWYHVAVTFDGGTYKLYIDGIEVDSAAGTNPTPNDFEFIMGAMDQAPSNGNPDPLNYFSGWLDELRIWNVALTKEQIRHMMNQEIQQNGANVIGAIVPIDIPGLVWTNLDGYYQMNQTVDIINGYVIPNAGTADGQLRNITTWQQETAPIPYTSDNDGNWNDTATDASSPWLWGHSVWDYPNALGIDGTRIDWNIVVTNHNITSNTQDVTLLGLLVESNELTISGTGAAKPENDPGTGLWVTHYLNLDGVIDLIGESQLVQKRYTPTQVNESILEVTSSGYLERDQQGTTNLFNYNYWSSPVSTINTTANNTLYNMDYALGGVLRGGYNSNAPTNIAWTSGRDATGSMDPIGTSTRWIYAYENYVQNTYAQWRYLSNTATLAPGLGFTMKGSGYGDPVNDVQNYVFTGKPNNATITTPINTGNDALIGNPYSSAIDASEFLADNGPTGTNSISGTLYFWIHYTSNFTHILEDYEGGYATYNNTGGNGAVTPPPTTDGEVISGLGSSTLIPGQYVPVGQGFFVNASASGGMVTFENDQRIFERETLASSVFLRSSSSNENNNSQKANNIKRVRLTFKSPEGAKRPLLLGFVPNNLATDYVDYGYDGKNSDEFIPSDMSWIIEDEKYVVQGVGDFDENKQYPVGIFLSKTGQVEIGISALENFDSDIDVFVYDLMLDTYTKINENSFKMSLDSGEYLNRFFIAFKGAEDIELTNPEDELDNTIVNYLSKTKEIYVNVPKGVNVKQVYLINILGQTINSWNVLNFHFSSEFKIPVKNISDGTYIIKVVTNGSTINKKIIVKK